MSESFQEPSSPSNNPNKDINSDDSVDSINHNKSDSEVERSEEDSNSSSSFKDNNEDNSNSSLNEKLNLESNNNEDNSNNEINEDKIETTNNDFKEDDDEEESLGYSKKILKTKKVISDSEDEEDIKNNSNLDNDVNDENESKTNLNSEKHDNQIENNKDSDNENQVEDIKTKEDEDNSEDESKLKKIKEADEILGNSDSEDEFEGFGKRGFGSDSENSENDFKKITKKKALIEDSDDEKNDEKLDFNKEVIEENKDLEKLDTDKDVLPDISSSEDEDDDKPRNQGGDFVYDFDLMMQKRKEQNSRSRKRKNFDLINDSDDFIADLLTQMKQAAEDDFELNKDRKAATRKMKLLPIIQTQLRKIDLRESFLESGVLGVMTDWLTPLPDRSLPNLQVRETMLKILLEFNIMDVERLKASGIGKAVMYLYKHPKEIKENKKRAGLLISNWSRPIFNCETDYQSISKEDREQRDYDNMSKLQKKQKMEESSGSGKNQSNLKPGDKGWVPRARVPAPSTKDYVVRPKSNIDLEMSRSGSKKAVSRLEKHLRNFQEKKRSSKMQRAVKISIEGRKL